MNKIKLNVTGNIFGLDGYSSHTRNLFLALYKHPGLDVKLQTQLPQDWIKQVNDAELDAITKPEKKEDWNIIIAIPHMWKQFLGLGKNACYCVWEGDKVPKSWIKEFMNPKVDLILVPSTHTRLAIYSTINNILNETLKEKTEEVTKKLMEMKTKIKIIPHGVDKDIFYSQRKKGELDGSNEVLLETRSETGEENKDEHMPVVVDNHADTFKFICNKGWRGTSWDRGGVQYLLKAFAEEFKKGENVQLIIKLNPAYINPQQIGDAVNQLNLPEDRAPIHINCDNLTPQKLNELYNSADCFICATRAESFNLPGLEAMSCGLPTIQTNFGGQTDYMNGKNSIFIDYELSESEEKPMYEGIQWAIPDIVDLRNQLRWAFENQDTIKNMGKQAEKDSNSFTWNNSANKIYEYLIKHNGTSN